jgi:hypothetical protein
LALGETELMRHLYPSPACEVVVRVELLLQFQGLVAGVGLATPSAKPVGAGK